MAETDQVAEDRSGNEMVWEPTQRPDWVRAVNEGGIVPIAEVAALPFTRDALLGEALAAQGLDRAGGDFGGDDFLEPFGVLVDDLEHEARLTVIGRFLARRHLVRLLEVRLQIAAYVRADPGVRDEAIREPVFVTGAPRTGTSILHLLLSHDPRNRVPEGWEFLRPVPPPSPLPDEFERDPRIAMADHELRGPATVTESLDAIHEYRGRMPKECLSAMAFSFRTEEFISRYHVPNYIRWHERCDMGPAYEMHRLVLQILQRQFADVQWVLKSPVHLHTLPALLAVYPDARVAVTHRDPMTVLASVTSLIATLRWAHSDEVDFAAIGRYHADRYHGDLDALVTWSGDGTLDLVRVHHGHYERFVADPIGAVSELYASFGLQFTRKTAQAMRDGLAARPQDKHGVHRYSFGDLGLDQAAESLRFARYRDHFGVPAEGAGV